MMKYLFGKTMGHIIDIVNLIIGLFAVIGIAFVCSDESDKVNRDAMFDSAVKNIREKF